MNLNIFSGVSEESFVSNKLAQLKPWNIYEVKITDVKYDKFNGKKEETKNNEYETLSFVFANDEGIFTKSFFAPKPGDEKRNTRKNANGHEVPQPSNLDTFKCELGQILSVTNPAILKALASKNGVEFKPMAEFIAKNMKKIIESQETFFIKLIGNSKNQPRTPYIVSFFEGNSEPSITGNFISKDANKLGFTNYELEQKSKIENAKPTNMQQASGSTDLNDINDSNNNSNDVDDLNLDLASL